MPSHLSHPEKTVTAKNEESDFQQASVWAARLPWVRQQVQSKKENATEVSTVCADSNQYWLCWSTY